MLEACPAPGHVTHFGMLAPWSTGPPRHRPAGLVLAPGAGGASDHPGLLALEEAAVPLGIAVARIDFPYRLAGRRAPDRPAVLIDTVRHAALALAAELGVPGDAIALGGRSMGGRICSMAVAAGLPAAALVLISYPLHPPGRPDRLRSEHFPQLLLPCLFVSGDRDAFATQAELAAAVGAIPGPVTHEVLPGGDHGLRRRETAAAERVAAWLGAFGPPYFGVGADPRLRDRSTGAIDP